MKKWLYLLPVFLVAVQVVSKTPASSQTTGSQKAKRADSKFAGKWRGGEKCKDASAPVAFLYIDDSGPGQVLLSGIYSIQGKIKATVKGDSILIARQEVDDPNFMNFMIEGELVYTAKPVAIQGKVTVQNNQQMDECLVKYNR